MPPTIEKREYIENQGQMPAEFRGPGWYVWLSDESRHGPFRDLKEVDLFTESLVEADNPSRFVTPDVDFVGFSEVNEEGLRAYLIRSGNMDFLESVEAARAKGLSNAEILCSFFAKLCYRSLTVGHNANITRTRDIWDNLTSTFDHGHGSVFEHVGFNFVISKCSRVFTHELVRHRIGTAFSQTSGRYCRLDHIPLVWDPILDPVKELFANHMRVTEQTIYLAECQLGLRKAPDAFPNAAPEDAITGVFRDEAGNEGRRWVPDKSFDFTLRKKITSAIRRIAPNGQANEIGFSVNLRSLRHTVLMRTGRFAEWEIRCVFAQIYAALKDRYPLIFHGAREEEVDGLVEVSGMKMQPYEKTAEMVLSEMTDEQIKAYLDTRGMAV